ncbi:MAG: hypothetical protein M1820_000194 [Bogoriella megaspora]|nr:MAG: hypothetical protein M1820_000194 [Bogoriella megaspora]
MTRLTHLELNLLSVTQVDQSWAFSQVDQDGQLCANFFVNYLRGLSNKGIDFKLSALKMLSLSHMPFNNAEEDMAAAFNFGGLKSLTLRQCSGVEELLDFLVESEQEIQFTSLELQCGSIDPMFEEQNTSVIDFLEQFSGLEEFYLGESNIMDTESLWRALGGHIPTLKRFVHHRCYVVDTGEHVPGLIKYQDTMEMGTDDNIFNSKDPHPREILAELDLTNLGVCCSPLHLKDLLEPFRSKNTLRLLHIRRAGKVLKRKRRNRVWRDSYKSTFWDPYQREARKLDPRDRLSRAPGALLDFAQWAFGPDGLPSLVVLAFGDFSYGGRFARWNQLLCRDPGPIERHQQWTFRSMFKGNCRQECWNVLKSNERFLQACPSERIIENDHDPDSDEEWEEWSQADFIGSP